MILWCGGGGRFSEPTSFAGVDPPLYYLFLLNDKQVGSYNLPKTPPSRFVPLLSQRTVSTRLVSRRVQVRHHVISYRCNCIPFASATSRDFVLGGEILSLSSTLRAPGARLNNGWCSRCTRNKWKHTRFFLCVPKLKASRPTPRSSLLRGCTRVHACGLH